MLDSRFQTVVFLHDREDNPEGHVGEFARILSESHPNVRFLRPPVPAYTTARGSFQLMAAALMPMFQPNSLVVGIGLGGLYAIAMQEQFPSINLSVFAVNPPPKQDELEYEWTTAAAYS